MPRARKPVKHKKRVNRAPVEVKEEGRLVCMFILDSLKLSPDGVLFVKDAFEAFKKWCKSHNFPAPTMSSVSFGRQVPALYKRKVKYRAGRVDQAILGLSLR